MNYELMLNYFLATGLLSVILLTLGFYWSYRRDKKLKYEVTDDSPTEGRYFRRYIPKNLHDKYGIQ